MLKIKHNDIKMTTKRKRMVESAQFFAKKLRIHKIDATITIAFKYDYAKTFNAYATCDATDTKNIIIEIDANLHNNILLEIVAHEMVHARQYLRGKLSSTKKGYQLWNGAKVQAGLAYTDQPWEREAMQKQTLLNYQFVEYKKELQ